MRRSNAGIPARAVRILGTHGVPAEYGGFETAAENVALYLREKGWRVIVYCQTHGRGREWKDTWCGLERVMIPVARSGWLGTSEFDLASIRHASKHSEVCLTFGYNTAIFNVLQKLRNIPNVINMDGIEWSRTRWGFFRQAILWTNEQIACRIGDQLIADHPEIYKYLSTRANPSKLTTITYGAHAVASASTKPLDRCGLRSGEYLTLICRPIPENSILEIVQGFSSLRRGVKLVILGNYDANDEYHCKVMDAASDEVIFWGAEYDKEVLQALRFHSYAYLHGHTVGGTNPSLVEAMAAGNAIIAHDNPYNRWVAQGGALYFSDAEDFDQKLGSLLSDPVLRQSLSSASASRHAEEFTWEHVAGQYESLLIKSIASKAGPNGKPARRWSARIRALRTL